MTSPSPRPPPHRTSSPVPPIAAPTDTSVEPTGKIPSQGAPSQLEKLLQPSCSRASTTGTSTATGTNGPSYPHQLQPGTQVQTGAAERHGISHRSYTNSALSSAVASSSRLYQSWHSPIGVSSSARYSGRYTASQPTSIHEGSPNSYSSSSSFYPPPYSSVQRQPQNVAPQICQRSSSVHLRPHVLRSEEIYYDPSSPLPELKYRSASVDEAKLHPKPNFNEFLEVLDEFITKDWRQMDQEKVEREHRRNMSGGSGGNQSPLAAHKTQPKEDGGDTSCSTLPAATTNKDAGGSDPGSANSTYSHFSFSESSVRYHESTTPIDMSNPRIGTPGGPFTPLETPQSADSVFTFDLPPNPTHFNASSPISTHVSHNREPMIQSAPPAASRYSKQLEVAVDSESGSDSNASGGMSGDSRSPRCGNDISISPSCYRQLRSIGCDKDIDTSNESKFKVPHEPRHPSLPNFHSIKRKSKPPSLNIPKLTSPTGLYQSWLRSPRVDISSCNREATPYTPPPMLGPVRKGSGLFASQFPSSSGISSGNRPLKRSSTSGSFSCVQDDSSSTKECLEPVINVGAGFQAAIPELVKDQRCNSTERAALVWSPQSLTAFSQSEVDGYLTLANSCAINGGGHNLELAYHVLHLYRNIKAALRVLLRRKARFLESSCPFIEYPYQNTTKWSTADRAQFNEAWRKHGKDFYLISKEVSGKSVKQVVEFYYLWKALCPNEVQDPTSTEEMLYNEENQNLLDFEDLMQPPSCKRRKFSCQYDSCYDSFDSDDTLSQHIRDHHLSRTNVMSIVPPPSHHGIAPNSRSINSSGGAAPVEDSKPDLAQSHHNMCSGSNSGVIISSSSAAASSGVMPAAPSVTSHNTPYKMREPDVTGPAATQTSNSCYFPCKLCGKVFNKVKSRNAHMKSHSLKVIAEREANAALKNNLAYQPSAAAAAAVASMTTGGGIMGTPSPPSMVAPVSHHPGVNPPGMPPLPGHILPPPPSQQLPPQQQNRLSHHPGFYHALAK